MIIDLTRFAAAEKPYWNELEAVLDGLDRDPLRQMNVRDVARFHYLYERVASDLGKIATFATEQETRRYLESLVSRAYAEIHETRTRPHRLRPLHWFVRTFPQTVRRHIRALALASALTAAGCLFGAAAIALDPSAKSVILPYDHLLGQPSERVAEEEQQLEDRLEGAKTQGAAWYMQHNTSVAMYVLAMGATWGIGTALLLFTNGVLLGAVVADYIRAGEAVFVSGWLLPHGAVEIPAILIAGQAGFVLAGALIGWRRRLTLRERLRQAAPDLVTLILGVAVLLTWAGIVESFLSQYHEPAIPYALKIALGCIEIVLLTAFLWRCGRTRESREAGTDHPHA